MSRWIPWVCFINLIISYITYSVCYVGVCVHLVAHAHRGWKSTSIVLHPDFWDSLSMNLDLTNLAGWLANEGSVYLSPPVLPCFSCRRWGSVSTLPTMPSLPPHRCFLVEDWSRCGGTNCYKTICEIKRMATSKILRKALHYQGARFLH